MPHPQKPICRLVDRTEDASLRRHCVCDPCGDARVHLDERARLVRLEDVPFIPSDDFIREQSRRLIDNCQGRESRTTARIMMKRLDLRAIRLLACPMKDDSFPDPRLRARV
jgi:hypothetical protein